MKFCSLENLLRTKSLVYLNVLRYVYQVNMNPKWISVIAVCEDFSVTKDELRPLFSAQCLLTVRLAGPGPGAVLAGGLFAVSRLSWQWSVVAEVFTLNNLFVGLLFFLTASFHRAESTTQRRKVTQRGTLLPSLGPVFCSSDKSLLR